MATRNYNTETTSQTTTNHSTETTTSPATTLTTTPGFNPIETTTTTNHSTETTTSPATTMTSTTSPVITKKPLHISIGVNYRGFIKYTNITNISTLTGTTTKISKYVINVGKLEITSTSSTSTLIDIITPSSSVSPTTTKADTPKPTSIPPIQICADDNGYHDGDVYLTYKASGAVDESDNVRSLPKTLTPVYDNSYFVFSSEYDWYYMKNGEKVEVLGGANEEIPLGVLRSTIIYIKVTSTTTSPTNTVTETRKSTQPPSSTSTTLNSSTTDFPST